MGSDGVPVLKLASCIFSAKSDNMLCVWLDDGTSNFGAVFIHFLSD